MARHLTADDVRGWTYDDVLGDIPPMIPAMFPVPTAATNRRAFSTGIRGERIIIIAPEHFSAADLAGMLASKPIEPVSIVLPEVDLQLDFPAPPTNRAARRRAAKSQRGRA